MAMRILDTMRKQFAWLWANPVPDGVGGFTYNSPRRIRVRWEDTQERFFNAAGEELISRSVVYVGEDLQPGVLLMLEDSYSDSSGALTANPDDSGVSAWPVRGVGKLPTLDASGYLRTCYL